MCQCDLFTTIGVVDINVDGDYDYNNRGIVAVNWRNRCGNRCSNAGNGCVDDRVVYTACEITREVTTFAHIPAVTTA